VSYTEKAVKLYNFTGLRFPREIIEAMGLIKYAAAKANKELGLLEPDIADAIMDAAMRLARGELDDKIVLEVSQTGSGTGLNMNVNEAIADEASRKLGKRIHPNDHVNKGQSSNDVVPSAVRLATALAAHRSLLPELEALEQQLSELAAKYGDVVKPGRTHLRDAMPVTFGQELSAYADAARMGRELLAKALEPVYELPIGGTAVGTGFLTHPEFGERVVAELRALTGLPLRVARNRFRAMRSLSDMVALMGAVRAIALDLSRAMQDIRLMFSGPYTGFAEVELPQEVAGSSIMAGKENPVVPEAIMQVMAYVLGLDSTATWAASLGELELNMGIPMTGYATVTAIKTLAAAIKQAREYVYARVRPNVERMRALAESSAAVVTSLLPKLGYDKTAEVAKRVAAGEPIRAVLRSLGLSEEEINKLLDLKRMTQPGYP